MTRVLIVAVALIATAIVQAQTPPTFELPAPTGKSPVGTTRWIVADPSRQETFAPGRTREVEVIAFYPAASSSGTTAPYLRNGVEEALSFARLARLGDAYNGLASIKTHSMLDALPARTPARFPVIVFSHGYTGLPSSHTALFEDLASHGWALQGRAELRRHSAIWHDDRYADAGTVPDGVFGAAGPRRRQ